MKKLKCVGDVNIRLSPSEKPIKKGDVIEDSGLVKLFSGHPCFELIEEKKIEEKKPVMIKKTGDE